MVAKCLIRIEGLYDDSTFKILKEGGIKEFSFDFRPLSFNFLPEYRLIHLLQNHHDHHHRYYLHFANEVDFVIRKILDDLAFISSPSFYLEFSDAKFRDFYEQFKVPYYWHYRDSSSLTELLKGQYLKGIILSASHLHGLIKRGSFFNFVKNFLQLTHAYQYKGDVSPTNNKQPADLEIILQADWHHPDDLKSILEHFDFHSLSLPINQSMEICYRQVNVERLQTEIKNVQKSLKRSSAPLSTL